MEHENNRWNRQCKISDGFKLNFYNEKSLYLMLKMFSFLCSTPLVQFAEMSCLTKDNKKNKNNTFILHGTCS